MRKAIVLHSIVPVRAEATETAGQETQLLFAETCTLMEENANWLRVENDADGVQGWVDRKMLTLMSEEEWQEIQKADKQAVVGMPMAYAVSENNGQTVPLTAGTRLPDYKDGRFELLGVSFRIDPTMVAQRPMEMNTDNLMQVVRFFLNIPYLWGGKNAMGMDCSGFVQVIYSIFGQTIRRNAREQAEQGGEIKTLKDAKAGDLAFFDHKDGKISHVGILLDGERIIHCSGRVKVEKVDNEGIYSIERGGVYTHHLVRINRYI